MPTHMIDSVLFRDLFGTEEMRRVWSDELLVQRWLDVEAALARAEARLGLVPQAAADEISRQARVELLDLEAMGREITATVHPIVPLVHALAAVCEGEAGRYIHWGATTQDIMDTAVSLQAKDGCAIIERQLGELSDALAEQVERHRDTPMAGRTHGQHAVPITFGYKAAVWLAEVERHRERLAQTRPRALAGQFAGAAGSLASVGTPGLEVQRLLCEDLGLETPLIAWHTARDGFAELGCLLAIAGGTAAKIANEVVQLQRTEILELQEPWHHGKVGSSTMPHKRNPMFSEAAVALSTLGRAAAGVLLDGLVVEHERDMRPWQAQWAALPELFVVTAGGLALVTKVVGGLEVDPARMAANLEATKGLILSERVMMELAPVLGRDRAHDLVYETSMAAFEQDRPLGEALLADEELGSRLPRAELERLLDPATYTGLCAEFCDRVLSARAARAPSG